MEQGGKKYNKITETDEICLVDKEVRLTCSNSTVWKKSHYATAVANAYRFMRHWMTEPLWLKHELSKHLDSRRAVGALTHCREVSFKDCHA